MEGCVSSNAPVPQSEIGGGVSRTEIFRQRPDTSICSLKNPIRFKLNLKLQTLVSSLKNKGAFEPWQFYNSREWIVDFSHSREERRYEPGPEEIGTKRAVHEFDVFPY
jgi:hypothetical protein